MATILNRCIEIEQDETQFWNRSVMPELKSSAVLVLMLEQRLKIDMGSATQKLSKAAYAKDFLGYQPQKKPFEVWCRETIDEFKMDTLDRRAYKYAFTKMPYPDHSVAYVVLYGGFV